MRFSSVEGTNRPMADHKHIMTRSSRAWHKGAALLVVGGVLVGGAVFLGEHTPEAGFREGVVLEDFTGSKDAFAVNLDLLRRNVGKHPQGEGFVQQAQLAAEQLAVDSNNVEAYKTIAAAAHILAQNETAIEAYRAALDLSPTDRVSLDRLATLYQDEREFKKAEAMYIQFIGSYPKDVIAYQGLADLYRFRIKEKEPFAAYVMEEGLAANPNHPDLLRYLAVLYEQQEQHEKATTYYERALAADPSNTAIQQKLEELKVRKD